MIGRIERARWSNMLAGLCVAGLLASSVASAESLPPNIRLLTTEPEDDRQPLVTPQGDYVVYVTNRSGDREIMRRAVDPRTPRAPEALAPSVADDHSPALSPDGKWLAWISTREDAFGDVWVMRYPSGTPTLVSARGTAETNPRWIERDGHTLLVFDSAAPGDEVRTEARRVGRWKRAEAFEPAPMDRSAKPAKGALELRAADDTNGDGRLSLEGDDASVWEYDGAVWRQQTPPLAGLESPAESRGRLVFSARVRGNSDVVVVEKPFAIAEVTSAADGLERARQAWRDFPLRPFEAVAFARQAFLLAPTSDDGRAGALLAADVLREAGRPEQAIAMLREMAPTGAELPAAIDAEVVWRRAALRIESAIRENMPAADVAALRGEARAALEALLAWPALADDLRARIGIELARQVAEIDGERAAFVILEDVEANPGARVELRAAAALERVRITARLLPDGIEAALLSLFATYPDEADVREQAALLWVSTAELPAGASLDERVLALRTLATSHPAVAELQAAAALREGELFRAAGRTADARGAFGRAVSFRRETSRLAARASFALAEVEAGDGRYLDAIRAYDEVSADVREQFFAGAPQFILEARRGFVRETLAKGAFELRVGDPQLAQATYRTLLEREPASVEAWRGILEAQSRTGQLDDAEHRRLRSLAEKNPNDALAWYVDGLATTYVPVGERIPSRARASIERAVVLDGSVPYFHQTLGFIAEAEARRTGERDYLARASDHYQRALALLDPADRPIDYARLLLNAGNATFALENFGRAADLYQRRLDQRVAFDDVRTEFLMRRNHGVALFRSARGREAAAEFETARAMVSTLVDRQMIDAAQAGELERELMDRRALALFDVADFGTAADLYEKLATLAPERSVDRVRALRMRGFALHRLSELREGSRGEEARQEAIRTLQQALELVQDRQLSVTKYSSGAKGLFAFDIVMGANATGAAQLNLDRGDEERLVRMGLARLQLQGGDAVAAIEGLRGILAQEPELTDNNRAYFLSARLVTLDQLAAQLQQLGRWNEAADALVRAIDAGRIPTGETATINSNGLTIALARLAEVMAGADTPPSIRGALAATWLGDKLATGDDLEALDEVLTRAMALRAPTGDVALLDRSVLRARLVLARALVAERQAELRSADGLGALQSGADAARARELAGQVLTINNELLADAETKRLAVYAHAMRVRLAARYEDAATFDDERLEALVFASRMGYGHLRWFIEAQGVHGDERTAEQSAKRALAELETTPAGLREAGSPIAWDLLAHLESITANAAAKRGEWLTAFILTERWLAARQRMALETATPSPTAGSLADVQWLVGALDRRDAVRAAAARLRALPPTMNASAAVNALNRATNDYTNHAIEGRAAGIETALLMAPQGLRLEDASNPALVLQDGLPVPRPVAAILSLESGTAAWTASGLHVLDSDAAWDQLAAESDLWYVMGRPLDEARRGDRIVVQLGTVESALVSQRELRLSSRLPEVAFPVAKGSPELGPLKATDRVSVIAALVPRGADPLDWFVEGVPVRVHEVLEAMNAPAVLRAMIAPPTRPSMAGAQAQEELLAASLGRWGLAEAELNGVARIGHLFDPKEVPEIAEAELQGAIGEATAAIADRRWDDAVAPAMRVYNLRRALERSDEDIVEAGLLLAQVQAETRDREGAARTANEILELQRDSGDQLALADALRFVGAYAGDARHDDEAIDALGEAAYLYASLGEPALSAEMVARRGVAMENAGRYTQALSEYALAKANFEAIGDARQSAEQDRRAGRIHLRRINQYAQAQVAFASALATADAAGLEDLALLTRLDLARVDERLGLFEKGIKAVDEVEARARELGDQLLLTDALLLRANIDWTRADYLEAFRAQREALEIAEALDDDPMRIIAHNAAGLIAWTLNDANRSVSEFDTALQIAQAGLVPSETATSFNNRGLIRRSMREWDRALDDFNAALAIDRDQQNRWGEAYALRNVGMTQLQRGDAAASLEPLETAIRIAGEIGDRTNRTKGLVARADALATLGRGDEAKAEYEASLVEARSLPLPEMEWRALQGLARLARAARNDEEARARLANAIDVVEKLRAAIRVEEFQDGFLQDKQSLYDDMVRLLADMGRADQAFEFSERARARNFIDLLGNARLEFAAPDDVASLERERTLRSRVEALQARRGSERDAAMRATIDAELTIAQREFTDYLVELRARNPQLSTFVEVPATKLADVQAIIDPGTKLLVYHVLDDATLAWVIGPDSINLVRLPVGRAALAERIQGVRERLQNFIDVDTELTILSRDLMTPLMPLLDGAKRVCVIPHRELHLVPFAALRVSTLPGNTEAMIDRFAVFYSPSASVLGFTTSRRTRSDEATRDRVLALGNPELAQANTDLPFAEKEAERIAWTFPSTDLITGNAATETWLRDNISNYGIIHIASHGQFDPGLPLMSSIELTPDDANDGRLTVREVFSLSIRADMVALSACQTGLGRLSSGDDLIGLNRAFVYAGTRQIMSSLWRVDDVSTAILVKHFYRNMRDEDRAEALREAMIEVRSRYPHPAHWSGMFLSGDWQ